MITQILIKVNVISVHSNQFFRENMYKVILWIFGKIIIYFHLTLIPFRFFVQMSFKFTAFVFILFFNNFYLDTSVTAAANYEWNSTNPTKNVRSFGKIFNDIYKSYCQKSAHLNEEVLILNFYYTYVKYATALADRFSNEEPSKLIDIFCRKKSKPKKFYDVELENEMSATFNKNFLTRKKAMPRAVGDQLWQLTFSFAARSLLGMLDVQDNLKFQYAHGLIISYNKADSSLQKLLMAYKLSSTDRGEHGIFPFRIIKCSHNQTQLHVAFEEEAEHLEEYSPEQMKYIVNFKLVLSFSEHTMTPYEVYKVIRAITMEYELNRTQNDAAAAAAVIKLPTVYTLFKHFVGNVDNIDNLRRVFINFKRLLYVRTNLNYCTIEPFNDGMPRIEINEDGDVRAECQDGFHEHPSYFAHAIRIDKHQCKEIVQVADDLQNILLEYGSTLNNFGTCRPSFLFNYLHDFLIKLKVLKESQELDNLKSNIFYRNFGLFKSQFSELLVPVVEEFKCTSSCPMLLYELNRKDSLKNIPKFFKILFDALNKVSDQVELDGKDRSLAFPILLGEQLLDRVYQLIEDGTNSICKIGETLDFVKTVQNIVASTGQFNFAQRSKAISPIVNSQLFKLFFSLAIRLTLVTEREDDLIGNHLRAFINAYKCIQMPPDDYLANNCFLQNQISNKKEQIKIQLCLECKNNDKIQEKIKKNFDFLLSLPDYSPSVYEVLKLAKELGNTSNGDIWIRQADPIFFLKIYQYLNGSDEKNDVLIKNGFCTFSDLIGDLLKQLVEKEYIIPSNYCIEDIIGKFFNTQDNLCGDNSEIENEKGKNLKARDELCEDKFGEENSKTIEQNNILHFGKAISINFNAKNDLQQIVPLIMKEVQEMLEKEDWNCTNLHFTKLLEWNLLKIELCKIGRLSEWEQIETLKTQWRDSFNSFFQNKEQIKPDFKAFAVKLTKILETIEKML